MCLCEKFLQLGVNTDREAALSNHGANKCIGDNERSGERQGTSRFLSGTLSFGKVTDMLQIHLLETWTTKTILFHNEVCALSTIINNDNIKH